MAVDPPSFHRRTGKITTGLLSGPASSIDRRLRRLSSSTEPRTSTSPLHRGRYPVRTRRQSPPVVCACLTIRCPLKVAWALLPHRRQRPAALAQTLCHYLPPPGQSRALPT